MKFVRLRYIGILVLVCLLSSIPVYSSSGVKAQDVARHDVFLPMMSGAASAGMQVTPTATLVPTKTPAPSPNCNLLPEEAEVAALMRETDGQQRPALTCNPLLAGVARARARDMAQRGYFDHVDPDGYGPNYLVRKAGYPLPDFYDPSDSGNNIESIGAGHQSADQVWSAWMDSQSHRVHLLGTEPFFAEQVEYGIGYHYAPESRYRHYWVVITARRAN